MIENIPQLVAIYSPTILSVIACLTAVIKIVKSFTDLRKEVKDKTDSEDLKADLRACIAENKALKKKVAKLIETNTKVHEEVE